MHSGRLIRLITKLALVPLIIRASSASRRMPSLGDDRDAYPSIIPNLFTELSKLSTTKVDVSFLHPRIWKFLGKNVRSIFLQFIHLICVFNRLDFCNVYRSKFTIILIGVCSRDMIKIKGMNFRKILPNDSCRSFRFVFLIFDFGFSRCPLSFQATKNPNFQMKIFSFVIVTLFLFFFLFLNLRIYPNQIIDFDDVWHRLRKIQRWIFIKF